jgi:hypothetical protein
LVSDKPNKVIGRLAKNRGVYPKTQKANTTTSAPSLHGCTTEVTVALPLAVGTRIPVYGPMETAAVDQFTVAVQFTVGHWIFCPFTVTLVVKVKFQVALFAEISSAPLGNRGLFGRVSARPGASKKLAVERPGPVVLVRPPSLCGGS